MDIIYALQAFANPALDAFMLAVTQLGSERAYIIFVVVTYLSLSPKAGQKLGAGLVISFYINFLLKGSFDTPRPFMLDDSVARSDAAIATAVGPGFPSGHAQSSATFWGLAAAVVKRRWFTLIAVILIALVSLSRVYLGVHLPVDILGGLVIGVLIMLMMLLWARSTEDFQLPLSLQLTLGISIPLALHLLFPTEQSDLLLGALAAFMTAPAMYKHHTPKRWWQKLLLAIIGISITFAVLIGSSLLLPEALKRQPLVGFVRYLGLGYAGLLLAPWLGRTLSLSPGE